VLAVLMEQAEAGRVLGSCGERLKVLSRELTVCWLVVRSGRACAWSARSIL
jgi:hypothetical protein